MELEQFAGALQNAVTQAGQSLVRVDDGSGLTATGVVWQDGVIVATSHGVERDENLAVIDANGAKHSVVLVGRDHETDIAVLQVPQKENAPVLTAITRTETPNPQVGTLAVAVARPGDAGLTATLGLVSRRFDTETGGVAEYILNTDAVLYPGMSGGALIDTQGQMIGLLNRLYGRGMGVALGVPLVARVVQAVLSHGRVQRGVLGVRTQLVQLPEPLRAGLGIAQQRGLLLSGVEPESPADKGGLLLGDTLLKIGGVTVEDVADLRRALRAHEETVIEILRGGTRMDLNVLVGGEQSYGR